MEEACMTIKEHKSTIVVLHKEKEKLTSTITGMEEEVTWMNSKIEHITKYVCMLNSGFDILDEILDIGEKKVIGINFKKEVKTLPKKTMAHEQKRKYLVDDHML